MIILLHLIFQVAGLGLENILSSEYAICLAIGLLADVELYTAFLKRG